MELSVLIVNNIEMKHISIIFDNGSKDGLIYFNRSRPCPYLRRTYSSTGFDTTTNIHIIITRGVY